MKLHIKSNEITVSLFFEKKKKSFLEHLDTKNITDNNQFWKTVKPFLANEISSNNLSQQRCRRNI